MWKRIWGFIIISSIITAILPYCGLPPDKFWGKINIIKEIFIPLPFLVVPILTAFIILCFFPNLLKKILIYALKKCNTDNQNEVLIIHSAIYGGEDFSKTVEARVDNNKLNIRVTNDVLGRDPMPHQLKNLEVEYSYFGKQKIVIPEKGFLVLPLR